MGVWKSLALPIVDYCSPLWFSPEKPGDISGLGDLQRSFFRQVSGLEELSYCDRLKKMKMYMVIYIWKIIEGKVLNCGVSWAYNERRGRERWAVGGGGAIGNGSVFLNAQL